MPPAVLAALPAIAAIASAAATVGGTAFQAVNASGARSDAEQANAQQFGLEQKSINDAAQQQKDQQTNADAIATRDRQRTAQLLGAAFSQGYGGTVLTSPLGNPGAAPAGQGKTLLGT